MKSVFMFQLRLNFSEAEEDFKKTATIAAVNTANRGRGRGSVAERGRNASNRGRQSVGRNITVNAFRRSERAIEISSSDDSEEEVSVID